MRTRTTERGAGALRGASWAVLAALLATLFAGAFILHRSGGSDPDGANLVSGEATVLMQAESLAYDGDLAYTRDDYERFTARRRGEPQDLELTSGSNGRRIAYDRPFPQALVLAPFVRLWPERGATVANALLFAAAAIFAALTLEAVLGGMAALWVAFFLFASVSFANVFLATGDVFRFALVVFAWGLIARAERPEKLADAAPSGKKNRRPGAGSSWRWLVVGALLAVPAASEPLYGLLAVAAFFAVPTAARGAKRMSLVLGFLLTLLAVIGVQWWWSGGLHFVATTRFRFTPETGFPLVDFTAVEWPASLRRFQALYWDEAPRFAWGLDPRLWLWNTVDLFLGQNIGLLPYFAPLLAMLGGLVFSGYRRILVVTTGVFLVALVVLHPFNLYGGEGAIGNRLFLPLYGAAFFLVARRPSWPFTAAAGLLAVLFMGDLWRAPAVHPIDPSSGYRHPTAVAELLLPRESAQRRLPVHQVADLARQGIRVELLDDGAWWESRRERFRLAKRRARLVIASPEPLASLRLDFGKDAPGTIAIGGQRQTQTLLLSDGGIAFLLEPGWILRRHAMWWSPERYFVYPLEIELPRPEESSTDDDSTDDDNADREIAPLSFELSVTVKG